jgi:dCTP deaminase
MIVVDSDLEQLIKQQSNPLLTGFDPPANWSDKNSLVQPCSIDLHIGEIFQPGVKSGKQGSAGYPKKELVLGTGQTAIIATQESIHLPANLAAFGFPPSHISSRALLMTNPGHVDPGYSGTLQFTVINMGKENYVLRFKDLIVTLLIFKLDKPVSVDYATRRNGAVIAKVQQAGIDHLSPDFVNVEERAKKIAGKIAANTLGLATAGATVLAFLLTLGANALVRRADGIDDMKSRMIRLEEQHSELTKELQDTKDQLNKQIDIDHRLLTIEILSKNRGAHPSKDGN